MPDGLLAVTAKLTQAVARDGTPPDDRAVVGIADGWRARNGTDTKAVCGIEGKALLVKSPPDYLFVAFWRSIWPATSCDAGPTAHAA